MNAFIVTFRYNLSSTTKDEYGSTRHDIRVTSLLAFTYAKKRTGKSESANTRIRGAAHSREERRRTATYLSTAIVKALLTHMNKPVELLTDQHYLISDANSLALRSSLIDSVEGGRREECV